jgi:hypothetical protein
MNRDCRLASRSTHVSREGLGQEWACVTLRLAHMNVRWACVASPDRWQWTSTGVCVRIGSEVLVVFFFWRVGFGSLKLWLTDRLTSVLHSTLTTPSMDGRKKERKISPTELTDFAPGDHVARQRDVLGCQEQPSRTCYAQPFPHRSRASSGWTEISPE